MSCHDPNIIDISCQWTKVFNVRHMRQLELHLNTEVDGWKIEKHENPKSYKHQQSSYSYVLRKNDVCYGGFEFSQITMLRWSFTQFWTLKQFGEDGFHKALLDALKAYGVEYEP